jgi:hypothetical protein
VDHDSEHGAGQLNSIHRPVDITNNGSTPDRLSMTMENGVMKMRPVACRAVMSKHRAAQGML